MRKMIMLALVCMLTVSGFAQMRKAKSITKAINKSQVSGIVTSEAIKAANKARNSVRPKVPHNHALDLNTLRQKNSSGTGYKIDSLHKAPDLSKYRSMPKPHMPSPGDMLRKSYLNFKENFKKGLCDSLPLSLLAWSDYADGIGDYEFAGMSFDKAKSEYLTVPDVVVYCSNGEDLRDKRTDLLGFIIEKDYLFREGGIEQSTPDSVRSRYRKQLTDLARDYDRGMIPLIEIAYRSEDSDKLNPYRMAADSIISGASSFVPMIQDDIFSTLLHEFMAAGQYEEALAYFAKDPLASYVENDAVESLNLCDASLMLGDTYKFNHYLQCAVNADGALAQEYFDRYYRFCCDRLVEDPTDEELMDWILEANDCPAEIALMLTDEIMNRYFPAPPDSYSFEWSDMSQFTQEELEILSSVVKMGSNAVKMDEGRSDDAMRDLLIFKFTLISTVDPTEIENAARPLDLLSDITKDNSDPSYDDLRVLLVIARAYIAAHGMDKPKEAYKILNRSVKEVESLAAAPDVKMMFWQYLRAACGAIGNKRGVSKCDKVINLQLNN